MALLHVLRARRRRRAGVIVAIDRRLLSFNPGTSV